MFKKRGGVDLIVTSIQTYRVAVAHEVWLWVAVQTDQGIVGWGEMSDSGDDEGVAHRIDRWTDKLTGRDPRMVSAITATLRTRPYPRQAVSRLESTAISGINQALWDILGQVLGVPLFQLWGGTEIRAVPLYANLNRSLRQRRSPEAFLQAAQIAADSGFAIVKCTPFDEMIPHDTGAALSPGLERLHAVAQVIPMRGIAIDCHQRFHPTTLAQFLATLNPSEPPYWVEDALAPVYWRESGRWRQQYPHIRWASGETANSLEELLDLLESQSVDVLMPDVKHVGGLEMAQSIMAVAHARSCWVSYHNPSGPIATAFSAHLSALDTRMLPMEYPWGAARERAQAVEPAENISEGLYRLPMGSGLGVVPRHEFLAQYASRWQQGVWVALKG